MLHVVPSKAREALLWKATDGGSFHEFHTMIAAQTQNILQKERPRTKALNSVRDGKDDDGDDEVPQLNLFDDMSEYRLAFLKWQGRNPGRRPPH